MALRIETTDSINGPESTTGPAEEEREGRGSSADTGSHQRVQDQLSPSETTRRLVDTFRRRGESPSSAKTWTDVRPMSPVSEGFLENLQSQRQRTEERVQVIKKLRQLKEQQSGVSESSTVGSANKSTVNQATRVAKVQPRASLKLQQTSEGIEPGALRHYGEIQPTKKRIPSSSGNDNAKYNDTKAPKDTNAKPGDPTYGYNVAHATRLSRATQDELTHKDDSNSTQKPVKELPTNPPTSQTNEKRETNATERSETLPTNEQVDQREPHHSQDDASLTLERDRANSFLVELAKAKAEILDLQQRLAATSTASQATRDELSKVKQQRTPFWKRGVKKHQHEAGLGSRTAEDNEDFVKQLLNVVHSLPVCDEICLRINLRNGEGGWEIVAARAENPRLKEDDNRDVST